MQTFNNPQPSGHSFNLSVARDSAGNFFTTSAMIKPKFYNILAPFASPETFLP
jgi:hypothetical protein